MKKITVIGGAGVRTVIFINGLLERYQSLNIGTVALYDIDKEKLNMIYHICKHVIQREGANLNLTLVHSLEEELLDTDYVVTTLRVGGDDSRKLDEELAVRHGVIGQETTGVGGFSMAARTLHVLDEYCKIIQEKAPNAYIFNFTNPSGLMTQALHDRGYDRVIGICDAPSSTKYRIAKFLKVKEEDLFVHFFGLNHLSWIRSIQVDGKELLGELLQSDEFLESIQEFSMFDKDLLRSIQLLPNEYLYYYYHREKALANMLNADCLRGSSIKNINQRMFEELKQLDTRDGEVLLQTFLYYMEVREQSYMAVETQREKEIEIKRGELEIPSGIGYAGVMLDCIEALQSDQAKYMTLCVKNEGSMKLFGDHEIIESTCKVSRKGIAVLPVSDVPKHCEVLLQTIKYYEKAAVKAIEQKDISQAYLALMIHPLIGSYSLAKVLIDELEESYGGLL